MSYNVIYEDIGLKDYKETWDYQEEIFQRLTENKKRKNIGSEPAEQAPGTLIFVEHPHVYTLGKSGSEDNLLIGSLQLNAKDAAFYKIDRGGDITYHGPGQIVGYPIFDLEIVGVNLREYIRLLEESVIMTLSEYGISGSRLEGATGVWIDPDIEGMARKICAIGVRASRYVTMHGFAFNVNTDLDYFSYINPCGFTDKGVTSLSREKGSVQDMDEVRNKLKANIKKIFDIQWINSQ